MSEDDAKSVKVVLLGDSGVGKTSIISRFVNNMFEQKVMPTISAAYATKTMKFDDFGGKELKFELWDTAGQERYRAVTKILYKDAQVIILVYDITRIDSFNEVKNYWYNQVKENCPKSIILGLAGNKADLFENENVTEEQGKNLAEEIGAIFKLTSSYENLGINDLFKAIGYKMLATLFPNYLESQGETEVYHTVLGDKKGFDVIEKNNIKIDDIHVKKKKKCC